MKLTDESSHWLEANVFQVFNWLEASVFQVFSG